MNPLVPLAEHPQLLFATHYIGVMGLTFILLLFQYLLARKSWWALLCALPFAIGFLQHEQAPHIVHTVAYLAPTPGEHAHICDVAHDVADRIIRAKNQLNPQLILLPEGAFRCALNTTTAPQEILLQAVGNTHVVLGSHRKQGNNFYNCVYCVRNGELLSVYDKELCVPFAEYVPAPWRWSRWLSSLFLQGHEQLCPGSGPCAMCTLPIGTVTPQICYDLYFRPTEPAGTGDIVLLTNDRWYPPYLQRLLFLLARMRAVAWGRNIWYIAHTGGWWLGKWGGTAILPTV